ncbi:MAG: SMP-30/gluconolactonase/LRE family protein [Acidimicrobiia bacterium]|nr:SMP-30/gluconolactonase/LRE family protein [Acidimicrobiia bacterium]
MPKFEPQPWRPPKAPALVGAIAENSMLARAQLWETGGLGPEDVAVAANGDVFTGLADGSILMFSPDGRGRKKVADAGGRPLGIEILADGELVVCNADLGLQRVTTSGEVTVLADRFGDQVFKFTNNAAVGSDGTIYFTDTSTRWGIHEYVNDLLEGQATGRVFARRSDGSLKVIVDGLQFANGLALDEAETSLFVAETGRYRIHRHWLKGDKAGVTEIFVDNLPGFPDNLSYAEGVLWTAAPSRRQGMFDLMSPRPWLRHLTHRLPANLKPKPVRHAIVLGFGTDGSVVHNLQDSTGTVAITTSARWHDGRLFIGTLTEPTLAVYEL